MGGFYPLGSKTDTSKFAVSNAFAIAATARGERLPPQSDRGKPLPIAPTQRHWHTERQEQERCGTSRLSDLATNQRLRRLAARSLGTFRIIKSLFRSLITSSWNPRAICRQQSASLGVSSWPNKFGPFWS